MQYLHFMPLLAVEAKKQCSVLPENICNATSFDAVVAYLITILIGFVGMALAIVILFSAIQYITSAGSPDRIRSAKDRLVQASVSMLLLISFNAIFNLLENNVFKGISGTSLDDINKLGANIINLLLGAVGVLSVIFIIVGGIQYSTSAGDPNKVSQAKSTIAYALIGLGMSLSIGVVISIFNTLAK